MLLLLYSCPVAHKTTQTYQALSLSLYIYFTCKNNKNQKTSDSRLSSTWFLAASLVVVSLCFRFYTYVCFHYCVSPKTLTFTLTFTSPISLFLLSVFHSRFSLLSPSFFLSFHFFIYFRFYSYCLSKFVQYLSINFNGWIPAVILAWNALNVFLFHSIRIICFFLYCILAASIH